MFAMLSLLLRNNVNPSVSLLIASQLSSIVCSNSGNTYSASRLDIERNLEFLLK